MQLSSTEFTQLLHKGTRQNHDNYVCHHSPPLDSSEKYVKICIQKKELSEVSIEQKKDRKMRRKISGNWLKCVKSQKYIFSSQTHSIV